MPSDWLKLEQIYDAALALPEERRHAFLDAECQGDETLLNELAGMLGPDPADHTFADAVGKAATLAVSWTGRRAGPYKILRELGRGGMGAVFLAVRDDDEFRKEVALKTLRFETPDQAAIERFRHERQLLAELDHPNIARLLDGGATADGTPWLVMEFVEGLALTDYCARNNLSIEARIHLFCQVCQAVQFAHQKLIVHRDIKPGNILVTEAGVPKLLDFGIAKLIGTPGGPRTMTGLLMMTPDYASPEQVRGEPVTTSTDVYGLGAVLFELLTSKRPHSLQNYGAEEITNVVCEVGVRPPSTTGASQLRGDLDNIVLKATHKDPQRRYHSAGQLGEDLRRYREFLPVIARPDTFTYRARKYVRRHWVGVSALTGIVAALTIGFGIALHQARLAEQRFQQVRTLSHRFIFDFNDQVRQLPGSVGVRENMVSTALEYLDNLSRTASSDPGLQWELAKAYEKVGDMQGSPVEPSLGHTRAARESYRKALVIQEELARRGLLNAQQRESLAHGYAQLAAVFRVIGPPQEALKAAERGLFYAAGVSEAAKARALSHVALAQTFAGEPEVALQSERTAETYLRGQLGKEVEWGSVHQGLAALYMVAGRAEAKLARFDEAAADLHGAIALREAHLSDAAPDTMSARELILVYETLGDVLGARDRFSLGREEEAALWYRKALALAEKLSAADSKNVTARIEIARSAGKLGAVVEKRQPKEALRLYERALSISEELTADATDRDMLRAAAYASMAVPLAKLGRTREAYDKLNKGIAFNEAQLRRSPKSRAVLGDLADDWLERGKMEAGAEAIAVYRKSLELADKAAAIQPNDFSAAFRQVAALEALIGAEAPDSAALRQRLVALWRGWSQRQPQSAFIAARQQQARAGGR